MVKMVSKKGGCRDGICFVGFECGVCLGDCLSRVCSVGFDKVVKVKRVEGKFRELSVEKYKFYISERGFEKK